MTLQEATLVVAEVVQHHRMMVKIDVSVGDSVSQTHYVMDKGVTIYLNGGMIQNGADHHIFTQIEDQNGASSHEY
jgi:hypothetical protein